MDGQTLGELDLRSQPFDSVKLAGPDDLTIETGTPAISVSGSESAQKALRFRFEDNQLVVGRNDPGGEAEGTAAIKLTMPPPSALKLSGSGKIAATEMRGDATQIALSGSGDVNVDSIESGSLAIKISGSGDIRGGGHVRALDAKIAGSGDIDLDKLEADNADISIAGSGDVKIYSNGNVKGSIAGSGDVDVRGRAQCSVKSAGSGSLRCGGD
ncbi:head GIN domain-containing protein [Altericroceibacterium spongiae]|nr:head GIN domain-containing protein [Altericroceibacterium spongiae]